MKTRTLFVIPIFIFVIVAIFLFASCTTTGDENGAVTPGGTPSFVGTWVNLDNEGVEGSPAKFVSTDNSDGTVTSVCYDSVSDTVVLFTITLTVTDEWTDSDGNLFLKLEGDTPFDPDYLFELIKIHADNQTMEVNADEFAYPTEMDPDNDYYAIWSRQ